MRQDFSPSNLRYLLCAIVLACGFVCAPSLKANAQVLILEVSDSHSAYDRLPDFLRSLDLVRQQYLSREPSGRVILLVNGDYGGVSRYTSERGWLGQQALYALAKEMDVAYVIGNHDAFDWGPQKQGNVLMEKQLKALAAAGVHLLGANVEFSSSLSRLTKDHLDLTTRSGRRLRFVGLGLEDFFKKSAWDPKSPAVVVEKITSSGPALLKSYNQADRDGVQDFIFFQHDGHLAVMQVLKALQARSHKRVKIPLAFAGHDHLQLAQVQDQTLLIDSRSDFDFSSVELATDGAVQSHEFYDRNRQKRRARPARSLGLETLAQATERHVQKLNQETNRVLGESEGFQLTKVDLKKARNPLGTALAETLRDWGIAQGGGLDKPVIALYNSSSYRRDEPIAAGELTLGLLESFYPFPGEARLYTASGSEIQNLFNALRQWRLNEDGGYTPQLSANVIEKDRMLQLVGRGVLEPRASYQLVLDPWLSQNGYNLPEFTEFFAHHASEAHASASDVFVHHGAAALSRTSRSHTPACLDLLAR